MSRGSPRFDRKLIGYHAINEALKRPLDRAILYLSRGGARIEELRQRAGASGVEIRSVRDGDVTRICGSRDHRGAVLVAAASSRTLEVREALDAVGKGPALVVLLDGITDERNLGAILRTADQFAADLVVIPARRSAQLGGVVETASAGASSHVKTAVTANLVRTFDILRRRGYWIYGAHLDGEPLDSESFGPQVALVFGSEGSGLGRLASQRVDRLIRIPTSGHVDSLNVSVAAGILMYEIRRSQGLLGAWRPSVIDELASDVGSMETTTE